MKKKKTFQDLTMTNYTFEQNLNAAETIVTKALCTAVEHLVHVICLIALFAYNLGKFIGQIYYEQTESVRAAQQIAASLHTTDAEMNVEQEPTDLWTETVEMFEQEIDEYCEKVRNVSKIHDLETQFLLMPAKSEVTSYDAPAKGRCRKGYRRIGNKCVRK